MKKGEMYHVCRFVISVSIWTGFKLLANFWNNRYSVIWRRIHYMTIATKVCVTNGYVKIGKLAYKYMSYKVNIAMAWCNIFLNNRATCVIMKIITNYCYIYNITNYRYDYCTSENCDYNYFRSGLAGFLHGRY